MSLTPEEVEQVARAAQAFERAAKTIESLGNTNNVTLQQPQPASPGNAVVIACAVMIGMNVFLSGAVVLFGLRTFDLDDKLSAIYMMAPHLKPKD